MLCPTCANGKTLHGDEKLPGGIVIHRDRHHPDYPRFRWVTFGCQHQDWSSNVYGEGRLTGLKLCPQCKLTSVRKNKIKPPAPPIKAAMVIAKLQKTGNNGNHNVATMRFEEAYELLRSSHLESANSYDLRILNSLLRRKLLSDVTPSYVKKHLTPKLLATSSGRPRTKHGFRRLMKTLCQFYRVVNEEIGAITIPVIELPSQPKRKPFRDVTEDAVQLLLAVCSRRPYPEFRTYLPVMILGARRAGLTRGELFSIERVKVDFDRDIITLPDGREVKMAKDLKRAIKAFWKQSEREHESLLIVERNNFATTFKNAAKAAGVSGIEFSDLRRAFAMEKLKNGASPDEVTQMLGYATRPNFYHFLGLDGTELKKDLGLQKQVTWYIMHKGKQYPRFNYADYLKQQIKQSGGKNQGGEDMLFKDLADRYFTSTIEDKQVVIDGITYLPWGSIGIWYKLQILKVAFEDLPIKAFSYPLIKAFKKKRIRRRKAATVDYDLSMLQAPINFAINNHWLNPEKNPFKHGPRLIKAVGRPSDTDAEKLRKRLEFEDEITTRVQKLAERERRKEFLRSEIAQAAVGGKGSSLSTFDHKLGRREITDEELCQILANIGGAIIQKSPIL